MHPGYSYRSVRAVPPLKVWSFPIGGGGVSVTVLLFKTYLGEPLQIMQMIKRPVVWREMHGVIKAFVSFVIACATCQQTKHASLRKKADIVQPLPLPEKTWEQIIMDFIT